jgi:hypothetical protein
MQIKSRSNYSLLKILGLLGGIPPSRNTEEESHDRRNCNQSLFAFIYSCSQPGLRLKYVLRA